MSSENTSSPARVIARNTLFGLGAQAALRVLGFLFQILIVRQLGDAEFGRYSIVLAWVGLFEVLGDLGISQYFAREVARQPEQTRNLFWDMVALRALLALLCSVVTTLGAFLYNYPAYIVVSVFLFTLTYFLQAVYVPLTALLTGSERVDITASLGVLSQFIYIIAGAIFLFISPQFIWLILASFISLPILIGITLNVVRRYQLGLPRLHFNRRLWWSIFKGGAPFALTHLALSFAFRVDTIILSGWVSDSTVGWYNIAYNLALSFLAITQAFNDAIVPTLARVHETNEDDVQPWYFRSVRWMAALSIPAAIGGMLLAEPIIVTLFGIENRAAAVAFFILIWDLPLVMYTSFCGNLTTSMRQERAAAGVYIMTGISNVVMNLLLIPPFGIVGASLATVLTDLLTALLFYALFRRTFKAGFQINRALRVGAAALLMGGIVWLISPYLHLFLTIPIAGGAYLMLIYLLGVFDPLERERITHLLGRFRA